MNIKTIKLQSTIDQLPLTAYCWAPPSEEINAIVIIAHGLGEHALRYDTFAQALNQQNCVVYALDHRGHGASPGPQGHGDFGEGGWNGLVEDIAQLVQFASHEHKALPVILFGHSMGSFACQQFLFSYAPAIDAIILSGSAALDQLFESLQKQRTEDGQGLSTYNEGFEHRTGFEWLSRDETEVDKYVADPLCGFDLTPPSMGSFAACAENLANPTEINKIPKTLPMLLLAGDQDPITGRLKFLKILQQRYIEAGIHNIDTLFYPEGRHEMLNEINRSAVYADLGKWIGSFVAAITKK